MRRHNIFKKMGSIALIVLAMTPLSSHAELSVEDSLKAIDELFPGQLISNPFTTNWYNAGDKTKLKMIKTKAVPGGKAIRFENKEPKDNPWNALAGSPINASVKQGDVVYVAFWAKGKPSDYGSLPKGTVRIAETQAPWAHVVNEAVEFADSWHLYYLKGVAPRSFKADELELSFHMGLNKQTLEIGQYYVMNLGQGGNSDALPIYYPGQFIAKAAVEPRNITYPATSGANSDYSPGAGYELVWADEFNDSQLNPESWNRQVVDAGQFNGEWQRYTDHPDNAYTDNGYLVLKALHESDRHGMNQYTSARLNTANKHAWQYGKIVARIQLPHSEGVWPAFWMLGANTTEMGGDTPWPACGEIDILELYGSKDDAVVEANIHYAGADNSHQMLEAFTYSLSEGIFADDFHIFEITWNEKKIEWAVDGKRYAAVDITGADKTEFHQEFFLLLNIAVGGTWAGKPDHRTEFPLSMYVDWIRVYQQS